METNEKSRPPGGASVVVSKESYGQLVVNMLEKQTGFQWKRDLWGLFSRYVESNHNGDKSANLLDEFWTFRDLVEFFENVEALQAGKEVREL
ncbi:MAG: hypothetical protein ABIN80_20435 [Dyadobacter sp.]|uniref:hypothetical protein n=1 Tax=Dyadobacter sp. TaxID=1914288 RepID=UPI003262D112